MDIFLDAISEKSVIGSVTGFNSTCDLAHPLIATTESTVQLNVDQCFQAEGTLKLKFHYPQHEFSGSLFLKIDVGEVTAYQATGLVNISGTEGTVQFFGKPLLKGPFVFAAPTPISKIVH